MTEATDRLHKLQADIRWAVQSEPPVQLPGLLAWQESESWFERWLTDLLPGLPEPELNTLYQFSRARLGKYFEALWMTYWQAHPDWEIRLSHFPIRGSERTLGELDAVLAHSATRELLHIELAVKFFLRVPHQSANDQYTWVGPNLRDSLGRKYSHMIEHQLPLGQHRVVRQALGRTIDRSLGVIKGRFFQPLSAQSATHEPQWLTRSECVQHGSGVSICLLTRAEWLSGQTRRPWWPLHDWLAIMADDFHPYQVLWQDSPDAPVVWRFIVPDHWPADARQFISDQQAEQV